MVSGIIQDFFIKQSCDKSFVLKFLVKDNNDYCSVMAEIPKDAVKYEMIKIGQPIWWHNPYVLIKIEESEDIKFKKVGYSAGDKQSYFKDKSETALKTP